MEAPEKKNKVYWLNMKPMSLENECWEWIPGYQDLYQVSNLGRIKSYHYNLPSGKILKQTDTKKGYLSVILNKNGERKAFRVHTLVIMSFVRQREAKEQAMHLNNNRKDNKLSNLRYGSALCNAAFKYDYGTITRPNSILNHKKANEIRALYRGGKSQSDIAQIYGVARCTVSNIIIGRTWAE